MKKAIPVSARFGVRFYFDRDGFFFRICLGFPVFLFSIYTRAIDILGRKTEIGFGWIPRESEMGERMPIWKLVNIEHQEKQKWQA